MNKQIEKGNMVAISKYLNNRHPDEWVEKREIEFKGVPVSFSFDITPEEKDNENSSNR